VTVSVTDAAGDPCLHGPQETKSLGIGREPRTVVTHLEEKPSRRRTAGHRPSRGPGLFVRVAVAGREVGHAVGKRNQERAHPRVPGASSSSVWTRFEDLNAGVLPGALQSGRAPVERLDSAGGESLAPEFPSPRFPLTSRGHDLVDGEERRQHRERSDVVFVEVSDSHPVQSSDAARDEDADPRVGAECGRAAHVNHRRRAGAPKKRGVSLPHVELLDGQNRGPRCMVGQHRSTDHDESDQTCAPSQRTACSKQESSQARSQPHGPERGRPQEVERDRPLGQSRCDRV
jgi:hypothetical protein